MWPLCRVCVNGLWQVFCNTFSGTGKIFLHCTKWLQLLCIAHSSLYRNISWEIIKFKELLLCLLQALISLEGGAMEPWHVAGADAARSIPPYGVFCVVASTLEHFLEKLRHEAFKLKQNLKSPNISHRLLCCNIAW